MLQPAGDTLTARSRATSVRIVAAKTIPTLTEIVADRAVYALENGKGVIASVRVFTLDGYRLSDKAP